VIPLIVVLSVLLGAALLMCWHLYREVKIYADIVVEYEKLNGVPLSAEKYPGFSLKSTKVS
jgi:hypothetical protein